MRKLILIGCTVLLLTSWQSCKKGGLGGDAKLVAFPKHHGKAIYGATVYVKFDTKDSPGSSTDAYDASFVGAAQDDFVNIEDLKQGNYYLYAIGYDSSITQLCYGGQSVSIKKKDKSDSQNIDISITE